MLTFVRPSRFCPSDQLASFTEKTVSAISRVQTRSPQLRNGVARSLSYIAGSSHAGTTANRHLSSLVKASAGTMRTSYAPLPAPRNIPARYSSAYGPDVSPPDFHAVAEVWLEGAWHIVDATGMSSAANLVVIASGRDAGDIPFMETANWAELIGPECRGFRENKGSAD